MSFSPSRIDVLLVDDQRMVGEAVRRMLAAEVDVTLHYCQDPALAVATALAVKPTVILQDLVMPGVEGLDLVTAYRGHPALRDVPLIVLSSKEEPDIKVAAFVRGANDYLVKLPHERELIARIRYHSMAYIAAQERVRAFAELEKHSRFIREVFGRYVSDEIVHSLLEHPDGLTLGGERRQVTVLMADLRGFSALAERLPPEQVVSMLNNYLEAMTEVILEHGGTIDEILGDGMLVIFGAPVARVDDARRAVRCAIAMQLAMVGVNQRARVAELPEVDLGIGVHTGDVVAGNIGSHRRAKYGVVGAAVNTAARIESLTVGGQILASEAARAGAGDDLRLDGRLEVTPKGSRESIVLHEVGGIGADAELGPLALPPRVVELVALTPPVPVRFMFLEGKHLVDVEIDGRLEHLSEIAAEIATDRMPRAFSDLCFDLALPGGPTSRLFGKVQPHDPARAGRFRVRYTGATPEILALLRATRSR